MTSGERVELNAHSPGLIRYIEGGLRANGATEKLVPPHDVIERTVRARHRAQVDAAVRTAIDDLIDVDDIVDAAVKATGGWGRV